MEKNNKKKKKYYYKNNNHNNHNNHGKKYYHNYYKKNKDKKKNDYVINNSEKEENILLSNKVQEQVEALEENNEIGEPRQVTQEVLNVNYDYEELEYSPIKKQKKTFGLMLKQNYKYALGLFLVVAVLFGVSYSFFSYSSVDSRMADIASGEVYVRVLEQSVTLTLDKMYPRTAEEARSRNDNYIDFTLKSKNTSEYDDINYSLNITNGEDVQGKTRINPEYLIVDLQEKVGNDYIYIQNAVPLSEFSFTGKVPINTTVEKTKEYRLRMWVSDVITISASDVNASYTPTQFANLYANFNVEVNSLDSEHVQSFSEMIAEKAATANYIASYSDVISSSPNQSYTTQDQISTSADKETVYYYTGEDALANANVLFAGYCWQIIRTTDNGGMKLLYNGVAVNNKCETTRTVTKGINGSNGTGTSLTSATLFGRSYDYNLATGEFTLEDSTGLPTSWNDSNYRDLIGTYTCKSNSSTCTTLYYVGDYKSSTEAYVASYTIGNVAHFSQLGTSAYNSNYRSPAFVGYMFNKVYDYIQDSKSGEYYSNAVWNGTMYVLSTGNSGTEPDVTHHYICDTDCTKVRFYYNSTSNYILLENGKTIEDALKEMINYKTNANDADESINVYNSAIKGYLDNWYKKNLTTHASYLDSNAVYCNDRSIINLGGWNSNGTSLTETLNFYQYNVNNNLNCVNVTDRFSTINSKAKLDYPIGILTEPERTLMTNAYTNIEQNYWALSPRYFSATYANVRYVYTSGGSSYNLVHYSNGVRAVITLKPSTILVDGTGTYTDPYIVGPIVTREN